MPILEEADTSAGMTERSDNVLINAIPSVSLVHVVIRRALSFKTLSAIFRELWFRPLYALPT